MTAEQLSEEKMNFPDFVARLRDVAREAMERTNRVGVSPYPPAADLLKHDDDWFWNTHFRWRGTPSALERHLEDFETQLRAHIRLEKTEQILAAIGLAQSSGR